MPSRISPPRAPLASLPDEYESGLVNLTGHTVLVLVPPEDIPAVRQALEDRKLVPVIAGDAGEAPAAPRLPAHAIVAPELAGALDLVSRMASGRGEVLVLAILAEGAPEGPALRAGARATLHRPLDPRDVASHLERFQAHVDLIAAKRELFERGEANANVGAVARVASAVAHEIRNPLWAARINLGYLQNPGTRSVGKDREAALQDADDALARIEATLAAISKLARGEKPVCRALDLARVARDALTEVPNPRGVPIELDADPSVRGCANEVLLRQVVVNLVSNALDALGERSSSRVLVRVYSTAGEARISVRDNGPGIPPEVRDRLFEPFFTTKGDKGTGLGLAISHQAVASMGGALALATDSSNGTCFRVRLPRA